MKEDRVYLLHIAEAIATIQEYVSTGRANFFAKKMIQDAVIRNLEIIGGLSKTSLLLLAGIRRRFHGKRLPVYGMSSSMIILELILRLSGLSWKIACRHSLCISLCFLKKAKSGQPARNPSSQ